MRDAHRMKEKFDVSLDNRQIVSLLIAGIVVMGAVFVLGVVVGKKLADNAQTAGAPDLLSALDANAQALQEVQKEPPLTFQDELTRKAAEPVAPPPAPKPTPKPAPAKPVAVAPTPAPAEKPAPAAEPGEEMAANSADEERAALAAKPAPSVPAAPVAKAPAPAPAGKVEQEPTPTRTATPPAGGLKEAIARATQPPAEAVKGGAFTLQISAFQSREEADRFAARLRDRGYAPYILAAEVPNKGTWYRVRMGSFPSKDAASRYLADFKRETQLNAFVAGTN
jgi:DedD protein